MTGRTGVAMLLFAIGVPASVRAADVAVCGETPGAPGTTINWCCDSKGEVCCFGIWKGNTRLGGWCDDSVEIWVPA